MATAVLTPFQLTVLLEITKSSFITQRFYLTGGTALAEFHLQHRLSEDLDFFSEEEFSLLPVQALIKKLKSTDRLESC